MRAGDAVVAAGTAIAVAGLALTVDNLRRLRVPSPRPPVPVDAVSVLLPVRDEERDVDACLHAVLAAADACGPDVEVLVLDDGSRDRTADVVREVAGDDRRVRLLDGRPPPHGWLGKPWACRQLSEAAHPRSTILVWVDADVVLEPHALAATVDLLRDARLDLVSPYPRQLAGTWAERLVQPLLQWSWASTLPLGIAERSSRPSLGAANGQLLAVDRRTYDRAGGHAAVRGEVLDDLALLRAVKAAGGRGTVADGTHLATCRMYRGAAEVRAGYAKSLWAAFGSPAGATAVVALLVLAHVIPPLAALRGSRVGLAGYGASVASRALVARRTGSPPADALAHPLSVVALAALTVDSWRGRRAGRLTWKGRPVVGSR
ncbi:MAG: glycosyltransferase family 2 protein [Nocardioidaceae bacterium]|nr:glycosyltransferase family 2 protein [Nocardioidaceae bacterium]